MIGISCGAALFFLLTIAVVAVLCRRARRQSNWVLLNSRSSPQPAIVPLALEMEQEISSIEPLDHHLSERPPPYSRGSETWSDSKPILAESKK